MFGMEISPSSQLPTHFVNLAARMPQSTVAQPDHLPLKRYAPGGSDMLTRVKAVA